MNQLIHSPTSWRDRGCIAQEEHSGPHWKSNREPVSKGSQRLVSRLASRAATSPCRPSGKSLASRKATAHTSASDQGQPSLWSQRSTIVSLIGTLRLLPSSVSITKLPL